MSDPEVELAELRREVEHQRKLIDVLYRHLGIGQLAAASLTSTAPFPDVEKAVRAGNLIEGIRLYRTRTNVGLKEAKDAVEALARDLGVQ